MITDDDKQLQCSR